MAGEGTYSPLWPTNLNQINHFKVPFIKIQQRSKYCLLFPDGRPTSNNPCRQDIVRTRRFAEFMFKSLLIEWRFVCNYGSTFQRQSHSTVSLIILVARFICFRGPTEFCGFEIPSGQCRLPSLPLVFLNRLKSSISAQIFSMNLCS